MALRSHLLLTRPVTGCLPSRLPSHPSSSTWVACDHGPNKPLALKSVFQARFCGMQPRAHLQLSRYEVPAEPGPLCKRQIRGHQK